MTVTYRVVDVCARCGKPDSPHSEVARVKWNRQHPIASACAVGDEFGLQTLIRLIELKNEEHARKLVELETVTERATNILTAHLSQHGEE